MTLSVLIPTYNYNARALVLALARQAEQDGIDAEILVGDDASSCETEWLQTIEAEGGGRVRVLSSAVNLGRAANRNRLADAARGEWLLFVDADAVVVDDRFLRSYLSGAEGVEGVEGVEVICGGICHPRQLPREGCELRWRYELKAEPDFTAECLNRRMSEGGRVPFRTFSFLIRRITFLGIRFDEHIRTYGCEDVLFGRELDLHDISIRYIDNPLLNGDLEPNAVYLSKTEEALRTLHCLEDRLRGYYRLADVAAQLRRFHLAAPVRLLYRCTHGLLRRNLRSPHPSLRLFAFYKLGYYLEIPYSLNRSPHS